MQQSIEGNTVSKEEFKQMKAHLDNYKKKIRVLDDFEKNPPVTEKQLQQRDDCKEMVGYIQRAINLIDDHELREIMEYRFIRGNPRKSTIIRFCLLHERTVDRKIIQGVTEIAKCVKDWSGRIAN